MVEIKAINPFTKTDPGFSITMKTLFMRVR